MRSLTLTLLMTLAAAAPAAAQPPRTGTPIAVEALAGYAGFVDDATIDHGVVGGAARFRLSPHFSIGPELIFMRGPDYDRDLFLTGNLTVDFLSQPAERRRGTAQPFVVVGAGLMRHSNRFGPESFSSTEGAVTGGAGARIWLTNRAYAIAEVRSGWELHYRITGGVGMQWD